MHSVWDNLWDISTSFGVVRARGSDSISWNKHESTTTGEMVDGGVAVESIDLDISCQCAGLGPLFCLFAYRTAAGCQLVSQSCGSA